MQDFQTVRATILSVATDLVENDRARTYGDPFDNMTAFAQLLEGYFRAKHWIPADETVRAEEAALILLFAKIARTVDPGRPYHSDTYVDMAGYASIAAECASFERESSDA